MWSLKVSTRLTKNSDWGRYLIEEEGVDVNRRDMWDAVPLYYSCLAGHPEVAEYLLEQGAGRRRVAFCILMCTYTVL